ASESDVVGEWKALFNILLGGTNVHMRRHELIMVFEISGECVSESSKEVKAILDEEFDDFGKFGRKVDLTFLANGIELANCEFKITDTPDAEVELQNKKNIRLNRAIMESHKTSCGKRLDLMFMDVQGWNGSLFSLHSFEDIFVSKYLTTVELPRSKSGLKKFLCGDDLEVLLTFLDHLKKIADDLKESKDQQEDQRVNKRHKHLFDRESSPRPSERRISGNVFLSPTISHKKAQ
ncbi:hypothetical protein BGZ76_005479, partial [Entomortierella beljakovae]